MAFFDPVRIIYRQPFTSVLKHKAVLLIYRLRLHKILLFITGNKSGLAKRFGYLSNRKINQHIAPDRKAQLENLDRRGYDVSQVSHLAEIKAHFFGSWIYDCRHFTGGALRLFGREIIMRSCHWKKYFRQMLHSGQ
jgi:hypothetical protein